MKRIISIVLSTALLLTCLLNFGITAFAVNIDDTSVFIKQEGSDWCTYAAATNMIRRRALLDGKENWSSYTDADLRSSARASGGGMSNSFSYAGYGVKAENWKSKSTDQKKSDLISLLSSHPEGIVIYTFEGTYTHAILACNYTNGTLYVNDPAKKKPTGIIKLTEAQFNGSSQDERIGWIKKVWYISSGAGSSTYVPAPSTPKPTGTWIKASTVNANAGDTVNLNWGANNANSYWLHIYRNGKDYINEGQGSSTSYSHSYPEGEYTAWVESSNSMGTELSSVNFSVKPAISQTSMTLKAPSSIGIDFIDKSTEKFTVEINGMVPNSSLRTICNNSISAEMKNWNGKTVDVYVTANYKIKDIDGILELQLVDANENVMDSTKIAVYNTTPLYSVSYNLNGGYYPEQYDSNYLQSKAYREYQGNSFFVGADSPLRDGYKFLGWSMNPNAGRADYSRGNSYYHDGKSNVLLYAVWEKIDYDFDLTFEEYEIVSDECHVVEFIINGDRDLIEDIEFDCDDNIECSYGSGQYGDGLYHMQFIFEKKGRIRDNTVDYTITSIYGDVMLEGSVEVFTFDDRNQTGITVYLDGEKLSFDVQPQIINGRTMVPMRKIFESLGAVVGWNDNTQVATAFKKGDVVKIGIGEQTMLCNDEFKTLDSPAVVINGRTLVPARAIAESFNCDVEWYDYGDSQVVDINRQDKINRMEEKTKLKIGWSECGLFSYINECGDLTGFDVDLAKYVCDFWGWEPEFIEIPFEESFESLQNGIVDCYWSCVTKTEEREEYSTFSNSYVTYDYEYEDNGEWYTDNETLFVPFQKGDYDTVNLVNIALEEAQMDGTIDVLKLIYGIE